MTETLQTQLQIWNTKPSTRFVYEDMFSRIAAVCGPGPSLEIGAGIGKFKNHLPEVISSDIQFSPWLDLVADAQNLPFEEGTFGNIVMLDVLHHVEFPIRFLRTASKVLKRGGRLIMAEPAITCGSALFYRFLHHEPVRMSADIFQDGTPNPDRDPYEANQAIPTLLARNAERFHLLIPELRITEVSWFAFAVYPLSGGFKPWTLVSANMARKGLAWERRIERSLGRKFAFRMLIVIQRA